MRQRQFGVGADHFLAGHLIIWTACAEAADEVHIEGSRPPSLGAHPFVVQFQGLGAPQPTLRVGSGVIGEHDGIEKGLLRHPAPRVGLVDRRDCADRLAHPVDRSLQSGQSITEVGTDGQHDATHVAPPAGPGWARPPRRERRATTATSANVNGIGA